MATMRDVAQLAGVSTATVSHVVNGTKKLSPETTEKVLMAIAEANYTPNTLAKSLRSLAPRWRWTQHLLVWLSLLLGAALGAASYHRWGLMVLLGPALIHAVYGLALALRPIKPSPQA